MRPLTAIEFSTQMHELLMLRALEKVERDLESGELNGLNAHSNDYIDGLAREYAVAAIQDESLDGWLSDINKKRKKILHKIGIKTPKIFKKVEAEVRALGRRIDKNRDKILIAAALVAGAVIGGPAIVGALQSAGAWTAGAAKTGLAMVGKAGATTWTGVKAVGSAIAKPFMGTPEQITEAENVVKSDAWYTKVYNTAKETLEKTTGVIFGSPESKKLLQGLVMGERNKILGALRVEKKKAVQRLNTSGLAFIIMAKWIQGMSTAQRREADVYLKRYLNLSKSLQPSQKAVYNNEIRSFVRYIGASPDQKLLALREIDKVTSARIEKREALQKPKTSLLLPALAVGAALAIGA